MRFLRPALAGVMVLALCAGAFAADDSVTGKNAAGSTVTFCSKDIGSGVMASCSQLINTSGTKINPATSDLQGTTNTKLDTLHSDNGAGGTSITQPTGGSGILGWLSGIYSRLGSTLTVTHKDSGGTDITDTTNHALKVNVVAGGAGGGAATIADSADVAEGGKADSAATDSTSSWSVISLLKGVYNRLAAIATSDSTIATNTANAGAPSVASDSTGNVKIIQANASAPISISTATTTQLVALTSSKKIYVTYLNYVASGTATVTLVTGTGTNCGTGQTSLGGAQDLTAQAGVSGGSGLGPILVVPAGQALCITNSAAQKVAGWLAYTVQP